MDLLQSSNYFKLVCGAGNEDKNEVEYLTYVYTLAGCAGFDVSASPEIVKSAKKGINAAFLKAHELNINIPFNKRKCSQPYTHTNTLKSKNLPP